ncbi:MAG: sulfurtransferase TusA family protein [Dehalobacterium sp.]
MKSIDCLGDFCPIPVLKLKEQLKKMQPQESVKLLSDHSCVLESIRANFAKANVTIEGKEVCPGIWEITVVKLT